MIDSENGHVVYCVLADVGGVEDKMITVPFNGLSKKGRNLFVINATKEKLFAAPVFRSYDMSKRSYVSEIYTGITVCSRVGKVSSLLPAWF